MRTAPTAIDRRGPQYRPFLAGASGEILRYGK
jgi:hypothetical protein